MTDAQSNTGTEAGAIADQPKKNAKKRLSGPKRRKVFLDAAAELLRTSGIESLTMERLAAVCDVNKALPYRFFANRDEVLVALMEEQTRVFDEALATCRGANMNFEEEVIALVKTWVRLMDQGHGIPALDIARTSAGKLEAMRMQRAGEAVKFIRGILEHQYELDKYTASLCAGVLLGSAQGFAYFYNTYTKDKASLVDTYVALIVGAVESVVALHKRRSSETQSDRGDT